MRISRFALCAALAAVLGFGSSGCQWFRDDAPPKSKQKQKAAKAKKPNSRKKRRDPADDMFFGIGKGAQAGSFANDNLNPREQQLLSEELREQDEDMRAIRSLHRDMDSSRSKRKEWVYGFKPLGDK